MYLISFIDKSSSGSIHSILVLVLATVEIVTIVAVSSGHRTFETGPGHSQSHSDVCLVFQHLRPNGPKCYCVSLSNGFTLATARREEETGFQNI